MVPEIPVKEFLVVLTHKHKQTTNKQTNKQTAICDNDCAIQQIIDRDTALYLQKRKSYSIIFNGFEKLRRLKRCRDFDTYLFKLVQFTQK